jgi:hypothetical protein
LPLLFRAALALANGEGNVVRLARRSLMLAGMSATSLAKAKLALRHDPGRGALPVSGIGHGDHAPRPADAAALARETISRAMWEIAGVSA